MMMIFLNYQNKTTKILNQMKRNFFFKKLEIFEFNKNKLIFSFFIILNKIHLFINVKI